MRARWRKVFLVIVAVRVLVAERELFCQAKRLQDEAQERVRNQEVKDKELLIRLDRYEKGEERHQQPQEESKVCLGEGNAETFLNDLSSLPSSFATPRKGSAKDNGGSPTKVSSLLI